MSFPQLDHLPPGPILVVAENDAIARGGLAWATVFRGAARHYRVRLAGPSSPEAIASEVKSLGAVAIIWAGTPDTQSLAASAAQHLAIPFFNEEILNHAQTP